MLDEKNYCREKSFPIFVKKSNLKTISMKKNHFIASVCIVGSLVFCACGKEKQIDEQNGDLSELWWNANTLSTLELRGPVHTVHQQIDEDNFMFMEFDVYGNIVSSSGRIGSSDEQTTYRYNDKNQLIVEENNGQITEYEYNFSEKYVPQDPRNWVDSRFIQSLAKISCSLGESWTFVDKGETLLAITENDTIAIQYDGNLPLSCDFEVGENKYYIGPVTYYKNGMLKDYVSGHYWEGKRVPTMVNSYIANSDWPMLQNSRVEEIDYVYSYNQTHYVKTITMKGKEPVVSSYEYEYDAMGNWIQSTVIIQYGDYPEIKTTTTRKITYY